MKNPIVIVNYNYYGQFGISGKIKIKDLFSVTTSNTELWTVSEPGEACYGAKVSTSTTKNYYKFIEVQNNNSLNYKYCSWKLTLDNKICSNNIFYVPSTETRIDYAQFLIATPEKNFNKMKVYYDIDNASLNQGMLLENNDNTKSKEVFTHIGFKNIKGILYEIDKSDLMKWTN